MKNNSASQPAPGQFFQVLEDGRYAFWFDASTISTFSDCNQRFYLKNVQFAPQQLRRKGPTHVVMTIGSWWSRVSELFYTSIAAGNSPTKLDMLKIAAEAWVEGDLDSMEKADPKKYEAFAIPIRAGEFGKYFPEVPSLFEELYSHKAAKLREVAHEFRATADINHPQTQSVIDRLDAEARQLESRTALPTGPLLMAAQYYTTFAELDQRSWKVIAAEAPFGRHGEVMLGETDKVVVYWQGKPDLVIWEEITGVLAPLDQKTKDHIPYNVNEIWKPHNQLAGYIYSVGVIANDLGFSNINVDRCIVSVCARLRSADPKKGAAPKPRFVRVRPHYSQDEIEEWRSGMVRKAERLRYAIESQDWQRNEQSCHVYGGCEFRGICSRPQGVRELMVKSDYELVEPWTPFEGEED